MTKYEPIDVSAELKAVSEKMSSYCNSVKEDLVLIRQPELDEYVKQIRLYLTEIPQDSNATHAQRCQECHDEKTRGVQKIGPKL